MFFWNKFCAFFFFVILSGILADGQNKQTPSDYLLLTSVKPSGLVVRSLSLPLLLPNIQDKDKSVPADFYTRNFGFFCKQELIIEKYTRLPIRLRLGSLQQCNFYEGKK